MTPSRTFCGRTAASARLGLAGLTAALALTGCLDRELRPLVPCVSQGFVESIEANGINQVDLLFVVDDSFSMEQEQRSLVQELPRLVQILASGDELLDGTRNFPPVADMHVAVVGTDMGFGGFTADSAACDDARDFGDDGLFRVSGRGDGCAASYPAVQSFSRDEDGADPAAFAEGVGCVANLGTGGCGLEQQLEAMLKSVTPAGSGVRFFSNTAGHGGAGPNAGFLRDDSLLVVVLVSDEDDCSTSDRALLDPHDGTYRGVPNVRCQLNPGALLPVARYAEGLRALRAGREERLVFAAITGVPTDLVGRTPTEILADERMTVRLTADGRDVEPACTSRNGDGSDRGKAAPGRRFVELAAALGEQGIVQSICQESFEPAIDQVIRRIGNVLSQVCLPRRLNPDATGLVDCDVVEVLSPPGTHPEQPSSCADLAGANPTPRRINPDGSIECEMLQRASAGGTPSEPGWYYDDRSAATDGACAGTQRIAFTADATPPNGVRVSLECLQRIQGSGGGTSAAVEVGSFCDPSSPDLHANPCDAAGLFCEPDSRTCQLPCATDADCPSSLLCDTLSGAGFCRNAICGD